MKLVDNESSPEPQKNKNPDLVRALYCGGRGTRTPTGLPPAVFKTAAIPLCDSSVAFGNTKIRTFWKSTKKKIIQC